LQVGNVSKIPHRENNEPPTQGTEVHCRKEVYFANENFITDKSHLAGIILDSVGDNSSQDDLIPKIPYQSPQGQQSSTTEGEYECGFHL